LARLSFQHCKSPRAAHEPHLRVDFPEPPRSQVGDGDIDGGAQFLRLQHGVHRRSHRLVDEGVDGTAVHHAVGVEVTVARLKDRPCEPLALLGNFDAEQGAERSRVE